MDLGKEKESKDIVFTNFEEFLASLSEEEKTAGTETGKKKLVEKIKKLVDKVFDFMFRHIKR